MEWVDMGLGREMQKTVANLAVHYQRYRILGKLKSVLDRDVDTSWDIRGSHSENGARQDQISYNRAQNLAVVDGCDSYLSTTKREAVEDRSRFPLANARFLSQSLIRPQAITPDLSHCKGDSRPLRFSSSDSCYHRGQPIGENSDKVSSYMGALGRDMLRIIVPDWRLVTQEAKEELWKLLKHIGTLWRSWKSRVTSDLKQALEDGWSDDEINSKLQPEGADLADWLTFRKERESMAFKETSKKFKELRSKHKLPHTTSRKGYARLEEEMLLLTEKINECQRRSSASSSQSINKDPIAQVFGPEHQGRVRGLRFGVTPSNVRATTQSTILVRKLQADFRRLEEKHEQLAELIRSQQMPLSSRQQQNNPPNICGKKCMILDWLSPKKIVGEGEVETDDPMHLMDGIPIGGNAYLVYVEPNAFLWRNQNNWTTLDNALGEVIPWPKEAVAVIFT
ncbi:hypothetical protein Sjap_025809 [Stephania japonica]|uniref:Transposase Tnp1/En/Spm-like domain-containing protein n=1 Tax=Stephania japonica TaxID=461633 RepID=A0AAP0E5J0_9MAGN